MQMTRFVKFSIPDTKKLYQPISISSSSLKEMDIKILISKKEEILKENHFS